MTLPKVNKPNKMEEVVEELKNAPTSLDMIEATREADQEAILSGNFNNLHTVFVKSVVSPLTGKIAMLPGTKIKLYPKKNPKTRQWRVLEERDYVKDNFPNIASKLYDIRNGIEILDEDYLMSFIVIVLYSGATLDKRREEDAFKIYLMQDMPEVGHSEHAKNPVEKVYIYDEQKESSDKINKKVKVIEAQSVVINLSPIDSINLLALFNHHTKGVSYTSAKAKLLDFAEKNPEKILMSKASPVETKHKIEMELLLEYSILKLDGGAVRYESEVLGVTKEAALKELNSPKRQDLKIRLLGLLENYRLSELNYKS